MTRIGFVIIATNEQPWLSINQEGQEKTWLQGLGEQDSYVAAYSDGSLGKSWQHPSDHRKVIFEKSSTKVCQISEPNFFHKNHACFAGVSGFGSLVGNSLSAIKHLIDEQNPDFIIRTNVSSFWNVSRLRQHLESAPKFGYYAGWEGELFRGLRRIFFPHPYASGAGMIFSRDVANYFVENVSIFNSNLIDDLAFGHVARKGNIQFTSIPRVDLSDIQQAASISLEELTKNFHFRCKSYNAATGLRYDVDIMRILHERFEETSS